MKARVKATTYRFNDGSFVEVFRNLNAYTLYFGRDIAFDIDGKFKKALGW